MVVGVQPCYQAIRDWVTKHAHNLICAGFIILIIEVSSGSVSSFVSLITVQLGGYLASSVSLDQKKEIIVLSLAFPLPFRVVTFTKRPL